MSQLHGAANELLNEHGIQVCSLDEKSGMQALERAAADLTLSSGQIRKRECNYIRHGTQTLIGGLNVGDGQLFAHVGESRTEEDFVAFMKDLISREPESRKFVFVLDQLNTHKSESLVRLMANLNDDNQDLGIKGKSGILKNMPSRMAYLEMGTDLAIKEQVVRLRFVFTPKHCSWLNPVEGWFSGLQKRVLRFGSFISTEQLADRVIAYANYYNEKLAKGINWTKSTKAEINKIIERTKMLVSKLTG